MIMTMRSTFFLLPQLLWTYLLLLLLAIITIPSPSLAVTCDSYAHPAESTRASKLTPNTFHKLCPTKSSSSLFGKPICGDGTAFSFYYTSPVQRRSTNTKVLIEFLGGGACWDADTCDYNAQMLTFPYQFDDFLGFSCSEIHAGLGYNGGNNNNNNNNNNNGGEGEEENENEGKNYQDDIPINMLCAQQVGDVDFREFHTVIVPYCTQDVHMGSNTMVYEGDGGAPVHHRGASNMLSVLEWVYRNFPHPEQIILTGCSAGGTVLPVAYDLVYHHYNSWTMGHSTALATMLDSPVYLTPAYFMENGLPNWNVGPLLQKIRFNCGKYGESEEFSDEIIKHILRRGSNKNTFGMVTHTSDPVSLAYYERMSNSYNDDDDDKDRRQRQRRLEDNQGADEEEWWSELSTSIQKVTSSHSNVYSYIIDGEGHCSFGLYYALLEGGDDFEQWAGNLMKVPTRISRRSNNGTGQGWFWISALVGCTLVGCTIWHQRRVEAQDADDDGVTNPHEMVYAQQTSLKGAILAGLQRIAALIAFYGKDAPITIAYGVAVTIYFIRLMTWDGLELFFYNPSLGPSATTLSTFGINNPTLAVYHYQFLRVLITSTFLCSGIVTYAMLMYSLYYQIRRLEKTMRSMAQPKTGRCHFDSTYFLQVAALIAIGSNLMYAMLSNGASCSSMALILGLQAFSCTMHRYHEQVEFPNPLPTTICMFLFTSLFLPYNSCIMMLCAIVIGVGLGVWVYWVYVPCFVPPTTNKAAAEEASTAYTSTQDNTSYTSTLGTLDDLYTKTSYDDYTKSTAGGAQTIATTKTKDDPDTLTLLRRNRPLQAILVFFSLLLLCIVFRIRRPNRMYEQPFLTGCELVYTAHVDEIAGSYIEGQFAKESRDDNSNDGSEDEDRNDEDRRRRRRRRLENSGDEEEEEEEEDRAEEHMCAQFCVPHLVSRPFIWGAHVYTGFDVQRGFCEDIGYTQHIADKTFSYKSYSVDVELYYDDAYSSQQYDNDDEGGE